MGLRLRLKCVWALIEFVVMGSDLLMNVGSGNQVRWLWATWIESQVNPLTTFRVLV